MEDWEAKVVTFGNAKLVLADAALVAEYEALKGDALSGGVIKKILKYAAQGGKKEKKEKKNNWGVAPEGDSGKNHKAGERAKKQTEKYINKTPVGEYKVDIAEPMAKNYNFEAVESAWYDWWEKEGLFKPDDSDKEKPTFVIMIPPPNVTGSLHIGHALTCAIQDCVVRWKRMQGFNTLWLPGTDHAGIATQVVVEKKLQIEEQKTRHDIGRDAFLDLVWKWKNEKGGHICKQLRLTGASVDWDREAFTMDDKLSRAVTESFVRLANKGLIYRDVKLVNWCPTLRSVISDLEVVSTDIAPNTMLKVPGYDEKVKFGFMFYFAYKVVGEDDELVIATTRPETMLGDTAVAVHPEDDRYKHLHGKFLWHPFAHRQIPIIVDDVLVDMATGTGAVKITPAHDPNDYESGKRHNLQQINILTDNGMINHSWGANEAGHQFEGSKRYDCRTTIMVELERLGLSRKIEGHSMVLPLCSRTKDVLEFVLKPQWFQNCDDMARRAVEAVEKGELNIYPESHKSTWYHWLRNIKDWCISRQLWWGHRIPAWFVDFKDEAPGDKATQHDRWVVAHTEEAALAKAAEKFGKPADQLILERDEDVLDTWYSSGLFPFSTLGWPDVDAEDFKMYYPGALLETGYDILFFWVARMVMMGLELTGKLPFTDVFLHTLVRDKNGRKMSKSLGNVLDPLWVVYGATLDDLNKSLEGGNLPAAEVAIAKQLQTADFPNGIAPCGSDGLRYALLFNTKLGSDTNLDINVVVTFQQFAQKVWQASGGIVLPYIAGYTPKATPMEGVDAPVVCKWALHQLDIVVEEVNAKLEAYSFADASMLPFKFFTEEFCGIFIEHIKQMNIKKLPDGDATKEAVQEAIYTLIETQLRLLHPFMPFATEELWQRLPKRANETSKSIMIAAYPAASASWRNEQAYGDFKIVHDVVSGLRKMKSDAKLSPKDTPKAFIRAGGDSCQLLETFTGCITGIVGCTLETLQAGAQPPTGPSAVVGNVTLHMDLAGLVDMGAELAKLEGQLVIKQNGVKKISDQQAGPNYMKMPEAKREQQIVKKAALEAEVATLLKAVQEMQGAAGGSSAGNSSSFNMWYANKCM